MASMMHKIEEKLHMGGNKKEGEQHHAQPYEQPGYGGHTAATTTPGHATTTPAGVHHPGTYGAEHGVGHGHEGAGPMQKAKEKVKKGKNKVKKEGESSSSSSESEGEGHGHKKKLGLF